MIAVASNSTNKLFVQQNTYFLSRKENSVSSKATENQRRKINELKHKRTVTNRNNKQKSYEGLKL